jgi:hypothetical protein
MASTSPHIIEGRDFINGQCKPGYEPYTYPHPLTGLPPQPQSLNCPGTPTVAPTIILQPLGRTIAPGQSMTLSVSATGSSPLQYQWKKNGINIAGAALSSYTISSTTTSDAGNYTCTVSNTAGSATSNVATITIAQDLVAPLVTITTPTNTIYTASAVPIKINLNEAGVCQYSLSAGASNISLVANPQNTEFTGTTVALANANYVLNAYCSDLAGNKNNSVKTNFTVTVSSTGGGGGGGSGSSGSSSNDGSVSPRTYSLSLEQLRQAIRNYYRVGDKVRFQMLDTVLSTLQNHSVQIKSIENEQVTILVQSTPQTATLYSGESRKFEITGDNYYDISVKAHSISANSANISILSIHEPTVAVSSADSTIKESQNAVDIKINGTSPTYAEPIPDVKTPDKSFNWAMVVAVFILIVVAIVISSQKIKLPSSPDSSNQNTNSFLITQITPSQSLTTTSENKPLQNQIDTAASNSITLYLRQQLAAGYSASQLVDTCAEKGWRKEIIEQAIASLTKNSV